MYENLKKSLNPNEVIYTNERLCNNNKQVNARAKNFLRAQNGTNLKHKIRAKLITIVLFFCQ